MTHEHQDEDFVSLLVDGNEDDVLDEVRHQWAKLECARYEPTPEELREVEPFARSMEMRIAIRRVIMRATGAGADLDGGERLMERCAEPQVPEGACGAFAEIHCPSCGQPLCFACAAEHCAVTAPLCGTSGVRRSVEERVGVPIPLYD